MISEIISNTTFYSNIINYFCLKSDNIISKNKIIISANFNFLHLNFIKLQFLQKY